MIEKFKKDLGLLLLKVRRMSKELQNSICEAN